MNNSTSQPIRKKCAKDFKFIGLIGEGSFSTVALAVDVQTKQKYAIKICEKRQLLKEKKAKAIMREKEILNLLDLHPNPYLIRLHFSFQDTHRLFFGLSFAKGGELLTYINKLSSFNEECTRFYSAQILLALEHLHKLGIIHRDLKPENILLNERLHIQITDFGSAYCGSVESIKPFTCDSMKEKKKATTRNRQRIREREDDAKGEDKQPEQEPEQEDAENGEEREEEVTRRQEEEEEDNVEKKDDDNNVNHKTNNKCRRSSRSNSFVGTAQYVSPEMLRFKRSFNSSDLWAYGCIIYQMLVASPPFNDATDFLIFQKILALNLTFPDGLNPVASDLIKSFLVLDPCSRLGGSDDFVKGTYPSIRSHPFFFEMQPDKWATLHTQPSPLINLLSKQDLDLDSRISCLNYDDIEPGLDEGLLLGLGLSDTPKRSDIVIEKVESGLDRSSSSSSKNSNSLKDNNTRTNNPGPSKKKGLFSKLFKH